MADRIRGLNLLTLHKSPLGWPLRQLRIPRAHQTTRGRADVVVAVIDLGYRLHPQHRAHLWTNPKPARGALHGWDCFDDDASLEYTGERQDEPYYSGHHAFVVGEVIACAPDCRVMPVRVGYGKPESWPKGVDWAVEHGARVLVMPHGFITHGSRRGKKDLFSLGNDFSYPIDNPRLRESLERAHDAGCLIVRGTADNRGRRVAVANAAFQVVMAVGSTDRRGGPADICCSADYVEAAAPGGRRDGGPDDEVWCTDGHGGYMSFTGGCMAAGFGGGVAALVWSRFPDLTPDQLRQLLRMSLV